MGLFALAAVGASTTQGKTTAPATPQATGTVTLAGWASSPTETKLLRQVIRGFEKTFPGIKVDYAPISGDYPAAMLAKFAARNPPDVFYVDSNVAPDWIKQRVLEPLDPFVAKSKLKTAAFFPSLLNGFKGPDRKLYGFPKDWSPLAMQTNNRLFKNSNVKVAEDVGRAQRGGEEAEGSRTAGRSACRPAGTGCSRSSIRTAARS